jgi:hypothetical protein
MVKRQTWVLLAVFAVLIGLAFFWTRYQNNWKASHPTPTVTPEQYLFTMDSTAVASLKISDNVSNTVVVMERDVAGQWILVNPPTDYTNVSSIETAVTQLTSLRVTSSLPNTENLAEFGLDMPKYTITVNVEGSGQLMAQVGNSTPTSSGYYVLVPGRVPQIVSKYSLDAVLKLLESPPIATPTITPTLEITATVTVPSATPSPLTAATDTPAPTPTATKPPATPTPKPQSTATLPAVTPTETVKP